jgi:ferredoxin-NADP reductase
MEGDMQRRGTSRMPAMTSDSSARMRAASPSRSASGLLSRMTHAPKRAVPVVAPAHMLPVQVIERVEIAPDVVTVYIVLPGTRQAPAPYLPGQFVTLALPTGDDTLYRSYSLCGDGSMDRPWELTIKRVNEGAVSSYFYEHVDRGTLLYASIPRGTFTLPADLSPEQVLTFVAVGSGITPIRGMLRAIANLPPQERPLAQLFYASRTRDDVIYGDELLELDPDSTWLRQLWYLSAEGYRLSVEEMLARAGRTAVRSHWYICGPDALKRELQTELEALGLPSTRYHAEIFATSTGPAYQLAARPGGDAGGTLRIQQTGQELDVQPQETLLAALERHGYSPSFSCRAGACGACKLKVSEGQVEPVGEALSDADRQAGYVLSCIAHPIGAVTLESGGTPPKGVPIVASVAGGAGSGSSSKSAVRVAAVASAAALLLASWNLTDHRPLSWGAPAAQSAQPTPSAGSSPSAQSTTSAAATTAATGGGQPAPTATKAPTGGGGAPAPTAAPKPAPTATPKPVCTSTATPGKVVPC